MASTVSRKRCSRSSDAAHARVERGASLRERRGVDLVRTSEGSSATPLDASAFSDGDRARSVEGSVVRERRDGIFASKSWKRLELRREVVTDENDRRGAFEDELVE